ncbi:MAG TPA: SulP family inorganic anion transporter [Acidimicrobiales bacterium]|nr:SulP family inorganic anion transporter [Acidimicrobiales bacterium]
MRGRRERTGRRRSAGDVVGGFVAGLYSVPEGIGYASLAGISPMLGINAGMVPVAVAAATTGSVLMMSTLTSAIALTVAGVLDQGGYQGAEIEQAVLTMTLVAGVFMAVLGVLRLGRVVDFLSNAVMTGFVMGVAVLITVGKLDEIVGYDPDGASNKVVKAADILVHPGRWDLTTTVVGVATIGGAFALKAISRLERYALVLIVVAGTAVVWILSVDTATIADQATLATGLDALPIPTQSSELPSLAMVPGLLIGALSIAVVALAQGAGVRPAFPNPDGTPADPSKDFTGQGLGNIAGALFQSAPTGGSLSRTAVSAEGGATSRLAGLVAALSVAVLVMVLGAVVGHIPEAVIGGLLLVIGVELITGRLPDARLAWRTSRASRLLFVITFVLTLAVPLQWAVLTGAVLSLLAYIGASTRGARLVRLRHDDLGWLVDDDVPHVLPDDEPLILRYTGPNFFAVTAAIADRLPVADPDRPGVLVLDLGRLDRYSSSMVKRLAMYVDSLSHAGSGLVLVGVSERALGALARTGVADRIGPENLLVPDPHIDLTIEHGAAQGTALLRQLRERRNQPPDPPPSTDTD